MPDRIWPLERRQFPTAKGYFDAVVVAIGVFGNILYGSLNCRIAKPISATEMECVDVDYDPAFKWPAKRQRIRVHCFGVEAPKSRKANHDGIREVQRVAKLGRIVVLPLRITNNGRDLYGSVSYAPNPADPVGRMRSFEDRQIKKGFATVKVDSAFPNALNWQFMLEEQSWAKSHRRGLWQDSGEGK